jgi:hypothetical protein
MKRRLPLFLVAVASVGAIAAFARYGQGSPAQVEALALKKYTLRVEGTAGVRLDLLLITKPTTNAGPTREAARITVPFSKEFEAARCFVWLDTLPDGAGGKKGDECRIVLETKGEATSRAETTMEPELEGGTSGLGDL